MATLADLMVKLGVDADGVDAGLDAATSSFESKIGGWKGIAVAGGAVAAGALAMAFDSALDMSSAQTSLQNQLNLTEAEAARAGDVAGSVYAAGFGGSLEEVSNATGSVIASIEGMGDASDAELQAMTQSALGLAQTFNVDVDQATRAVGQMLSTGLVADAETGMDLITATMQQVPAALRDDLLPTVEEYGTQFRNLGLSGADAMGLMVQGVNAGARDIDVVADTLKEFSIEAVAGSDKIGDAWEELGLNSEALFAQMGEGGDSAREALGTTLDALRDVEDPVERAALATELFGTKAEDMGDALYALDPATAAASTGLDDVAGSSGTLTENMQEDPAQMMESGLRTLSTTLGELLLPVLTSVADFAANHPTLFKIIAGAVLVAAVAFTVLSVALWAVNAAVLANPITWIVIAIIAAIVLLIAIIAAVIVYWDEIVAAVVAAWNWIKEATAAAVDWLVQAFQKMGQWIVDKWNAMWSAVGAALSAAKAFILSAIMAVHNWIMSKVAAIVNFFVTGFNNAKTLVSAAVSALRAAVISHVTKVVTTVKSIPGKIKSAMSGAKSWLVNAGKDIIRGLINGVQNMIGSLKSKFSEITNMIPDLKGPETVDLRLLEPAGEALMIGLDRGITDGWGDVQGTLRGITGAIPGMVNTQGAAGQSRFAGPQTRVVIDFEGLSRSKLAEAVREAVRIDGGGSVDQAFSGTRS